MENNVVINFVCNTWFSVGAVASIFVIILMGRNHLKQQGYVTIGDFLMGILMLVVAAALGWLSMLTLGYMLREHFEGFFSKLMQVKLFRTQEYKTKSLLFNKDDDPDDFKF